MPGFLYAMSALSRECEVSRGDWSQSERLIAVPRTHLRVNDALLPCRLFLAKSDRNGQLSPWLPLLEDITAEDWYACAGADRQIPLTLALLDSYLATAEVDRTRPFEEVWPEFRKVLGEELKRGRAT